MEKTLLNYSPEVKAALGNEAPVLALESTIISHGMPYPQNLEFALQAEDLVRSRGVVPATIALADGKAQIGIANDLLKELSQNDVVEKVALRDIASALAKKKLGACTVSATAHLAHLAGIKVFSTGGIGGVHRGVEFSFDISQDLRSLGKIPIVIVAAGAKAVLDIGKTLEYLETEGVCILGYQTKIFPAFYSRKSRHRINESVRSAKEIGEIFTIHRALKISSAILVANPVPADHEIPVKMVNSHIETALQACRDKNILGKAVTPFLLDHIVQSTGGKSLETNIALALNNIKLGAEIALELARK